MSWFGFNEKPPKQRESVRDPRSAKKSFPHFERTFKPHSANRITANRVRQSDLQKFKQTTPSYAAGVVIILFTSYGLTKCKERIHLINSSLIIKPQLIGKELLCSPRPFSLSSLSPRLPLADTCSSNMRSSTRPAVTSRMAAPTL